MQIELQNIHKHYGPVKANNGVSLKVAPGRIHGIRRSEIGAQQPPPPCADP